MIGGTDICFPTRSPAALDAALRAIRTVWPRAVFEDADNGQRVGRYEALPLGPSLAGVFVYRDSDAASGWDKRGAVSDLLERMVYLIRRDLELTAVVGDATDPVSRTILDAIRESLRMDIMNITAESPRPRAA